MLDGMSVRQNVLYNSASDDNVGLVDMTDDKGSKREAVEALVFMIVGLDG